MPLEWADGKLRLGEPRPETIRGWQDGLGFVDAAEPGVVVAIQWYWACVRLDARQVAILKDWTARELAIANTTF